MQSCPASTPRLKPTSASSRLSFGRPSSVSTLAKPKPWIRQKVNATSQLQRCTPGYRLLSAASTTDAAIADSTRRDGSDTTESAASARVIECATVKAVTTRNTSQNAGAKRGADNTAGSSSDSRNSTWSKPIQMCQTP